MTRKKLDNMFAKARSRTHDVYYHQLWELDEATYAALVRNHRGTLARLKAIGTGEQA